MFIRKPDTTDQLLNETIERVLNDMKTEDAHTEKYASSADQLVKLYALKTESRSRRVSPDTMATVIANLLGIGIIVGHERVHIVTSKALSFVQKLR